MRSAAGEHVLRIYVDRPVDAIRVEHELLRRIAPADLPFATPTPIPSRRGETIVVDTSTERYASLSRRIPGEVLNDDDADGVERAAAAFARLDAVYGTIARTEHRAPSFAGDLLAVHPAISDLTRLRELLGDDAHRLALRASELAAPIYASLPKQLTHGDVAFGNVLLADGRVSGILDFEYAAHDVRARDLSSGIAVALSKGSGERIWRRFLVGHLSELRLDAAEFRAIPSLALMHGAVILVWSAGRLVEGHMTRERIARQLERIFAVERWFDAHGTELVDEALRLIT